MAYSTDTSRDRSATVTLPPVISELREHLDSPEYLREIAQTIVAGARRPLDPSAALAFAIKWRAQVESISTEVGWPLTLFSVYRQSHSLVGANGIVTPTTIAAKPTRVNWDAHGVNIVPGRATAQAYLRMIRVDFGAAALVGVVIWAIGRVAGFLCRRLHRRWTRKRQTRGLCAGCGYDLSVPVV
jgi:hypothetical protein